jgi:hypothetical protein
VIRFLAGWRPAVSIKRINSLPRFLATRLQPAVAPVEAFSRIYIVRDDAAA